MKPFLYAATAALVLAGFPATDAHAGSFKESWYLSRGKANMKIHNYNAAIEAFEKLIELNPEDREAMRLLGTAYESQGLTDKAIDHYDRYLERFPGDAEIAFKQARYIEDARLSYRRNDAIRYYRMGLKSSPKSQDNRRRLARLLAGDKSTIGEAVDEYSILVKSKPRDAGLRIEYARLLGSRNETTDQAIRQYRILIDQQPRNSAAHRELAAAYGWRGDTDRAIYHSQLALRYDTGDRSAARMRDDLMEGREPELKAGLTYINQTGKERSYDYTGFLMSGGGKTDITPFVTGEAELGREIYDNDETGVDGTFTTIRLQARFDPTHRVDASWKHHDFDDKQDDGEFLIRYTAQKGEFMISPGIRREFRNDSLLALAGERVVVAGRARDLGAARSNTAFFRFAVQGDRAQASLTPYFGYVSADSTGNNSLTGADAELRSLFFDNGSFVFSTLYTLEASHYSRDASGFVYTATEPLGGGYFSPDLFVNNVVRLEAGYQFRPESELRLSAGPSVQYSRLHSGDRSWNTGADLDLSCHMNIGASLYLATRGSYNQIADIYRRYDLGAFLIRKF